MKTSLLAVVAALGVALASVGHAAVKGIVLVHGAFAEAFAKDFAADVSPPWLWPQRLPRKSGPERLP